MSNSNKEEIITRQVLDAHGRMDDLKEVRMRNVFDNRWRVNVWCYYEDPNLMSNLTRPATIKYSYFIRVDDSGNIVHSDPELGTQSLAG
tara:strand:+ start:6296 stop:6562 length:267 start_codon:yes stop_codon:yes gene_type:complete